MENEKWIEVVKTRTESRVTTEDRKKAKFKWTMTYNINGYKYKFNNIYMDEKVGVPYGYCSKNRTWVWLYEDGISLYGRDIDFKPGIKLSEMKEEK